jgi:hypothetical protein
MCVMPDSNATPAITESRQADFPHSLLELRIKRDGKLSILGCKKTLARDRF